MSANLLDRPPTQNGLATLAHPVWHPRKPFKKTKTLLDEWIAQKHLVTPVASQAYRQVLIGHLASGKRRLNEIVRDAGGPVENKPVLGKPLLKRVRGYVHPLMSEAKQIGEVFDVSLIETLIGKSKGESSYLTAAAT
jgi:hypothetical protein